MDITLSPDNLTQCARIYLFLSQENKSFLVINCLFCNKDYSEWLNFYKHMNVQHFLKIQLEETQLEYEQDKYNNTTDVPEENQLEISKKISKHLPAEGSKIYGKYLEETPTTLESNEEFLEEYLMDETEEYEKFSVEILGKEKLLEPLNTCFFRLYKTDSKIIFKFIDLLRQHPSQWEDKISNFSLKDKRLDSTINLTQQLNECFKMNLTPQGTRNSVLTLIRWFEREYIRLLNCRENNFQFICPLKEYFEKLLEFLPYNHLKPMKCEECLKSFKSEHLLMAHKHKYHNGQIPFRCRYCGHGFIHQSSHRMHENRHIKLQVWPCNLCLYQAASHSDYIKHLATHSSRQPHKCSICGLRYKTKTNLNVHVKSHSLPAYECEFCKKKFYEKYRYKRHIWLHDKEEELLNKSIDNFTCDICGRRFASKKTLNKHQLIHVQENYKLEKGSEPTAFKLNDIIVLYCDYCSLEFEHQEAHEMHMNLKHNIKVK